MFRWLKTIKEQIKMSKLLKNKVAIHIASEVVVLLGLTYYFSSKNRKLLEHIEDLSQRLEEHEEVIQSHTDILNRLVQARMMPQQVKPQTPPPIITPFSKKPSKKTKGHFKKPSPPPQSSSEDEAEEFNDGDLDDELADEFAELDE